MLKGAILKTFLPSIKGMIPPPRELKNVAIAELPKLLQLFIDYLTENTVIPEGYSGLYVGYKRHNDQIYFITTAHDQSMDNVKALSFKSMADLINSIPDEKIKEFIDGSVDKITQMGKDMPGESSFKKPVDMTDGDHPLKADPLLEKFKHSEENQTSEQHLKLAEQTVKTIEVLAENGAANKSEAGLEHSGTATTERGATVEYSTGETQEHSGPDRREQGNREAGLSGSPGEDEGGQKPGAGESGERTGEEGAGKTD